MKANCKKFSRTIKPKDIPKTNAEIRELLTCLELDVEAYISSLEEGIDDFVKHFKTSILPALKKNRLYESFESQLEKYIRVQEAKNVSVFHNFRDISRKTANDFSGVTLISKSQRLYDTKVKDYFLIEAIKTIYIDFAQITMFASQLFFSLEFSCKILCALGCLRFALNIARGNIIQHAYCLNQLRRFSNRNCDYCETCAVNTTCTSKIDFGALSRIYCYSMKIRQVADYTPNLISLNIQKSGLFEPPFVYFNSLKLLIEKNSSIYYKCFEDINLRVKFREFMMKDIFAPPLWSENRLKQMLEKKENVDFYNYLLGQLYFNQDRFDEAIEPLEKAKANSPNNPEVWTILGTIYDAQAKTKEDLKKAIDYYKKAKDLAPNNSNTLFELGILELADGDDSSFLANLTKALEFASTNFEKFKILVTLSEAYRLKGMIEKSEYYLKQYQRIAKLSKLSASEQFINNVSKWLFAFIDERAKLS